MPSRHDPNPQILSLMSTQHLYALEPYKEPGDSPVDMLNRVVGWRQIACRRIWNKYQWDALQLSEVEWEDFDIDCCKRGFQMGLQILDAVVEGILEDEAEERTRFPPATGDVRLDEDEMCDGEDWKNSV